MITQTLRLTLRQLTPEDAAFVFRLVNTPSWLTFIGDKKIRNLGDAVDYIIKGPLAMYQSQGFGLFLVQRKIDEEPVGLCGLLRRDGLEDVDLGFAILPEYQRQGYASEASRAVMTLARKHFHLQRLVAITTAPNIASIQLLEKLGLGFERTLKLAPEGPEYLLYGRKL